MFVPLLCPPVSGGQQYHFVYQAAGYERVGFRVHGEPCLNSDVSTPEWQNNRAHSGLIGVLSYPSDRKYGTCNRISGKTARMYSMIHLYGLLLFFKEKVKARRTDMITFDFRLHGLEELGIWNVGVKYHHS